MSNGGTDSKETTKRPSSRSRAALTFSEPEITWGQCRAATPWTASSVRSSSGAIIKVLRSARIMVTPGADGGRVVKWVAGLACNQEVMGSIPAPFQMISREPAVLKCVRCQENNEGENYVGIAALI